MASPSDHFELKPYQNNQFSANDSDSNDSLEPPFEIHGIQDQIEPELHIENVKTVQSHISDLPFPNASPANLPNQSVNNSSNPVQFNPKRNLTPLINVLNSFPEPELMAVQNPVKNMNNFVNSNNQFQSPSTSNFKSGQSTSTIQPKQSSRLNQVVFKDDLEENDSISIQMNTNDVRSSDYESDDDEVPSYLQYETAPLVNESNVRRGNQRRQYNLSHLHVQRQRAPSRSGRPELHHEIYEWKDVRNIDDFLGRIYEYYDGKGYLCIVLTQLTQLLTVIFIVFLSIFLTQCIDFNLLHESKKLSDVLVPNCVDSMSFIAKFIGFFCICWSLYTLINLVSKISSLLEIKRFMNNILDITDAEVQTILWKDVVVKIVETSSTDNTHTLPKLDAHKIANRILRKENYMIAMFNKDILSLNIPLLGQRQWMTWLMQDFLIYGIFSYVFDGRGLFRKRFLKSQNKMRLVEGLKERFRNMAIITTILSPFLFVFLIIRSVFKVSEEYRQNPSLIAARTYSPLSFWKMREFNEMPHLFNKRLIRSYDSANKYMQQFPNHYVIILSRFITFLSGSLATVLLLITLFEEDLQQGFEITPNRSAFFYIGLFGSIMTIAQGLTQENVVHEPQKWMLEVVSDTHYHPDEWRDKAHTPQVRDEFGKLYEYKMVLLIQELISVLIAPILLYYTLPDCADKIVDFFREFTVHVDSLGHVCSFAIFDFERHGNVQYGGKLSTAPAEEQEKMTSKNGKMESSFLNFKSNHPEWDPGNKGSEFTSRILRPLMNPKSTLIHPLRSQLGHSMVMHRMMGQSQAMSHSEIPPGSLIAGESMLADEYEDYGRDLFGMLDAFYKTYGHRLN